MYLKCLGCGREIGDVQGEWFVYTCPCGATMLEGGKDSINNKTRVLPPASFIRVTHLGEEPAHIDYYLGKSSHWSVTKQQLYDYLRSRNAIWSWECDECRDHVIQRAIRNKEYGLLCYPPHKDLELMVNKSEKKKVTQ